MQPQLRSALLHRSLPGAAAVTGFVEGEDGLALFISAIPYNFYALLTIVMMVTIAILNIDFGSMKVHEDNAKNGDLFTTPDRPYGDGNDEVTVGNGGVKDLVIPILSLIVCCVIGMIWTGGFFAGENFVTAFSTVSIRRPGCRKCICTGDNGLHCM